MREIHCFRVWQYNDSVGDEDRLYEFNHSKKKTLMTFAIYPSVPYYSGLVDSIFICEPQPPMGREADLPNGANFLLVIYLITP